MRYISAPQRSQSILPIVGELGSVRSGVDERASSGVEASPVDEGSWRSALRIGENGRGDGGLLGESDMRAFYRAITTGLTTVRTHFSSCRGKRTADELTRRR